MKIARESPLSRTRYILRIPYELRINVAEFGESGARFNLLPTREDRSSFRLIALRHDARVTPASLEIVKRFLRNEECIGWRNELGRKSRRNPNYTIGGKFDLWPSFTAVRNIRGYRLGRDELVVTSIWWNRERRKKRAVFYPRQNAGTGLVLESVMPRHCYSMGNVGELMR